MSVTLKQLLSIQEDVALRVSKGRSNYKKTPKERKTKHLSEIRLEALEKIWERFVYNHAELFKTADPDVLKETSYIKNDVFETTEELYVDYKCLLRQDLYVETSAMSGTVDSQLQSKVGGNKANIAKLPKIVIPKFTGDYTEWTTFRDLFKSLVHDTEMDNAVKMQYLKGLLGGEAEQLVRNMSITTANYDKCWATLLERYNNTRYLCNTILKRLFNQRSSNSESASFLKEILDNTTECIGALANLGVDVSTWDIILIYMTSLKLDPESRKQWELESANISGNELPKFKTFQEFLTKRFRALEFVNAGSSSNKSKVATKSFHAVEEANVSVTCKFCKEQHKLVHCKTFENEEVSARREFVEKQRLCFNCLGENHSANQCRCKVSCRVCRKRHHTYLHLTRDTNSTPSVSSGAPPDNSSGEGAPVVCFASKEVAQSNQVLLATALIKAETSNGDNRIVRASLDQGSQASFITEATAQYLGLKRIPVRGVISGVGGGHDVSSKSKVKINIASNQEDFKLSLEVYVLKSITSLLPSKQVIAADWVWSLPLADPRYNQPNRIDLLLGAEVVSQVMREGIQKQGTLLAQNTSLGWILSGVVGSSSGKQAPNLIAMHQVMCFEEDQQPKQFLELEDIKVSTTQVLTEEETRCEQSFEETTIRDEDGRYIVKLPFKSGDLKVENSKRIAEKRITYLEVTLDKAKELKAKYNDVLEEYLDLDHMEKVPEKEINNIKGTYLPHFAVVRDDKDTTKVRIVFDASCKGENGVSLNDMMMTGPTLQPELRNLLMRWRLHRICLSSDIVKMYRQVKVAAEDVDFQRILWRRDQPATSSSAFLGKFGNQSELKLEEFRLLRVTFGTASAPCLAVKALQQVAIDEGANHPAAAAKVKDEFYMDDLLTGCDDIDSAMQLYSQMNKLLNKGGFDLQKWSSNSKKILTRIKETGDGVDKEDGLKLKTDEAMKLLGLTWNRRSDAFEYTVTFPQLKEPVTKRLVISDNSRLCDPIRWVASKILEEWFTYRKESHHVSSLRITRWLQSSGLHEKEVTHDKMKNEEASMEIKDHIVTSKDNLGKLIRVVTYCRRFISWKKRKKNKEQGFLDAQEMKDALERCFKHCQKENLTEEIASIEKNVNGIAAKLKGPFKSLNSFLDDQQILRIGGQLEMLSLSDDVKPVVISKKLEFTTLPVLTTVLGQIEACLNSRPLSRADTESEGYDALTPGHFLVGEPLLTVPDYSFEPSNMGSLRRWQLTQKMTQDFWRRWSQEYLSNLIHRYKWSFQSPEPAVGDLVLVKEEGLPPSRWLLGRVIIKHPGPDNITRVVSLRTKSNVMKRPTSKLCILPITA